MTKILMIDDDARLLRMYQTALEKAGFQVEVAADGATGRERALKGGYDAIVLDIMLPLVNGLEILESLKDQAKEKRAAPVIVLTNLQPQPLKDQVLNLGAKFLLEKGETGPHELVEVIKSVTAT